MQLGNAWKAALSSCPGVSRIISSRRWLAPRLHARARKSACRSAPSASKYQVQRQRSGNLQTRWIRHIMARRRSLQATDKQCGVAMTRPASAALPPLAAQPEAQVCKGLRQSMPPRTEFGRLALWGSLSRRPGLLPCLAPASAAPGATSAATGSATCSRQPLPPRSEKTREPWMLGACGGVRVLASSCWREPRFLWGVCFCS